LAQDIGNFVHYWAGVERRAPFEDEVDDDPVRRFGMRDSAGKTVTATTGGVGKGVICCGGSGWTHGDALIDRGFDRLAIEQVADVAAPLAEPFGRRGLGVG
jgi:hypothetical protein